MLDDSDKDHSLLAALDPTLADMAPVPGSSRYRQLLERAMTTTDPIADEALDPATTDEPPAATAGGAKRTLRPDWRWIGAVAAVVVAMAGVVVVLQPDRPVEPAAAVAAAAVKTGDVRTLRVQAVYTAEDGRRTTVDADLDGGDALIRYRSPDSTEAQGPTESAITAIGSTVWEMEGDRVVSKRTDVPQAERNEPYQRSSEAVVEAALTGSEVTDLGREAVRGSDATHYRISLTDASIAAISALPASQTAQFELEYPQAITSFDVWVDDALIRRIDLRSSTQGRSTIEFYDFGADITVIPPT